MSGDLWRDSLRQASDFLNHSVSAITSISFGKLLAPSHVAWKKQIQLKAARTLSALAQMKSIKMAGLDREVSAHIKRLRFDEIELFKTHRTYRGLLSTTGEYSYAIPVRL